MGAGDGPLDEEQYRGVEPACQVRHLAVRPVNRDGVLGQVVCADAKEVNFLGQPVSHNGRGRHFHHDAELDFVSIRNLLKIEPVFFLLQQRLHLLHFFQQRDHRHHDAQIHPH